MIESFAVDEIINSCDFSLNVYFAMEFWFDDGIIIAEKSKIEFIKKKSKTGKK